MKTAGTTKPLLRGRIIALLIIVLSLIAIGYVYHQMSDFPSTDDASIDADVVHIASPVGGRIINLAVTENQHVNKGDLLFEIDPEVYRQTVKEAEANVELARATLASRRKTIIGEQATAAVAVGQHQRAAHNYELATRTVQRLTPLATQGYVPTQQLDQAQVAQRDAAISLKQADEQMHATSSTIGDISDAVATLHASEASLAKAQRALADTIVKAPQKGIVTGLSILAGETITPNQSIFTLINNDDWFAVANFRETSLGTIKIGDCATVYSMIDNHKPLRGKVVSIGAGIADTDRINIPHGLPYVEQSVNWVRIAKRFPVRIHLEQPDDRLVKVGASANVEVNHGYACR